MSTTLQDFAKELDGWAYCWDGEYSYLIQKIVIRMLDAPADVSLIDFADELAAVKPNGPYELVTEVREIAERMRAAGNGDTDKGEQS